MRWLILMIGGAVVTTADAAPSRAEMERTAKGTCASIAETRDMDGPQRVEQVNDAREELGLEPYLEGDEFIVEAVQYGICERLVLDLGWQTELSNLRAAVKPTQSEQEEQLAAIHGKIAEQGYAKNHEDVVTRGGRAYLKQDDSPFTGVVKSFGSDGALERTEQYANGRLHGKSEAFRENGTRVYSINYVDGRKHGRSEWFYENGTLERSDEYVDGRQHGNSEGFYKSGVPQFRIVYVAGERNGVAEWFYEDGAVEYRREYENGEQVVTEAYDQDGTLRNRSERSSD